MHVSLSDLVTCPRCGPDHGLILLPDEVRDRRVVVGALGCPNCRERYRVEQGVADLRSPEAGGGGSADAPPPNPAADEGGAVRLAALMDLADAAGAVLLVGPAGERAGEIAALVPGVEVVVAAEPVPGGEAGEVPVSRIRVGSTLPFRSGSMRGVALSGGRVGMEEGARVVAPGARLVVEFAGAGARGRLEALGLRVLVEEGGTVIAAR